MPCCSPSSSIIASPMSVRTHAGQTLFERMPVDAKSIAIVFISIETAAFDVEYAAECGPAVSAAADEMPISEPLRSITCGNAARATRNGAMVFVRSTRSKLSGVCSSTEPECEMPAFSTAQSSPPSAATVSATTRSAVAGSLMSPTIATPPMSPATAAIGSGRRPFTATRQPSAANRRAIASPMPLPPPVTSTARSVIAGPGSSRGRRRCTRT